MIPAIIAALLLQGHVVGFDGDATRLKSITVDGACILGDDIRTSGIYLIGSADGSDAQGHSVISVGGTGGRLKSDDPMAITPPEFQMRFTRMGPNRLGFAVRVGPMPQDMQTISLPFDFGLKMMDRFAFDGDHYRIFSSENDGTYPGSGAEYTAIKPKAVIRDVKGTYIGKVGGASTDSPSAWGEVDGPYARVRVTITGSQHYEALGFMNHPGTHNMEFGFGKMKKGETASLSGEILVTPKSGPSRWSYDGPSEFYHQIGRTEADGWSARVGDERERYMCFGPYATEIGVGPRVAVFTAMLDNVDFDDARILTLDVADSVSGKVLASVDLTRHSFRSPLAYQAFALPFVAPAGAKLEFRTLWHGASYARIRGVTVLR